MNALGSIRMPVRWGALILGVALATITLRGASVSRPVIGDRDGDGDPDATDLCPDDAEDRDGFEDEDGCPDPDNDKDRILDVADRCPNQRETYNGFEDEDGCPDETRVVAKSTHCFVVLDAFYFGAKSATVRPVSMPVVDDTAATLRAQTWIRSVTLRGHRSRSEPVGLDEARARAVAQLLVERGITTDRLIVKGVGTTPRLVDRDRPLTASVLRMVDIEPHETTSETH